MSTTLVTHSEQETVRAAWQLGAQLSAGAVVLLVGELGSGKTAFVRGLLSGLGGDPDEVTSPTFTLIQEYRGDANRHTLYHVDLYRLEPREVEDLGLEELVAGEGIVAIEWADRLPHPVAGAITVRIIDRGGDDREIGILGPSG